MDLSSVYIYAYLAKLWGRSQNESFCGLETYVSIIEMAMPVYTISIFCTKA